MTIIEDTNTEAPEKPAKKKSQVIVHRKESAPIAPSLATIVDRAIERGLTGDDLKGILEVQERWEANEARKAFDVAMANAQADMPPIVRTRLVEYGEGSKKTSYRHEELAEVIRLITPTLKAHGIAFRFRTDQLDGGQVRVTCIVTGHGHREETSLQSSRDSSGGKNDIQAVGSVVSYLERYTLKAALGLAASHDDDGQASEGGNRTITALQLHELEALAKEVNANVDLACKHLHIGSLAELPASQFDRVKQSMEAKRPPL